MSTWYDDGYANRHGGDDDMCALCRLAYTASISPDAQNKSAASGRVNTEWMDVDLKGEVRGGVELRVLVADASTQTDAVAEAAAASTSEEQEPAKESTQDRVRGDARRGGRKVRLWPFRISGLKQEEGEDE